MHALHAAATVRLSTERIHVPGTAMALKWQWLPPDLRRAMYRSKPTISLPPAAKQLRSADRYLRRKKGIRHG